MPSQQAEANYESYAENMTRTGIEQIRKIHVPGYTIIHMKLSVLVVISYISSNGNYEGPRDAKTVACESPRIQ